MQEDRCHGGKRFQRTAVLRESRIVMILHWHRLLLCFLIGPIILLTVSNSDLLSGSQVFLLTAHMSVAYVTTGGMSV